MVHEPIEQRRGHLRIDEHAGPLAEVQVGRDRHAGVLVEPREEVEEQSSAGLAKGQIAQLVEDANEEGNGLPHKRALLHLMVRVPPLTCHDLGLVHLRRCHHISLKIG